MILWNIFFIFAISLSAAVLLTPWVKQLCLARGIMDLPERRKVHAKPVPTLGGLAIFSSFFIAILFTLIFNRQFRLELIPYLPGLILGSGAIVLLGVAHDLKDIHPFVKLGGQIVAALMAFNLGFRIEAVTNPFGGQLQFNFPTSLIVSVLWIISLINALNLIDGLDGLAAGLTAISLFVLLSIALFKYHLATMLLITALMGSSIGFLRYNFYPAKIFMGDTGSMFLGFTLACISILGSHKMATSMALLIPLIALGIPIFDTSLAVIRRLLKRRSIFKADKRHLHHRLLEMGMPHKQVVLFLYLVCAYFGVIAFLFVLIPKEYAFILLTFLAIGVFIGVRTIGFIERKVRTIHRMQKRLNDNLY